MIPPSLDINPLKKKTCGWYWRDLYKNGNQYSKKENVWKAIKMLHVMLMSKQESFENNWLKDQCEYYRMSRSHVKWLILKSKMKIYLKR